MFLSDNNSGVHPEIFESMHSANKFHMMSYGGDSYTKKAEDLLAGLFEKKVESYFVTNGTAANVVGLSGMIHPYEAVLCADTAHINNEECGAFERLTSSKLVTAKNSQGKLRIEDIERALQTRGDEHFVQVKVVEIAQITELGTYYTCQEIKELADFCHQHDLFLFMDGARIANALAREQKTLKEMTEDCGVDIFSFGGTKNGLMYGEAIVVLNEELFGRYKFLRKQSMQLLSKMRYISAQFIPYIEQEIYLKNAMNSNTMMDYFVELLHQRNIQPVYGDYGNIIFLDMNDDAFHRLNSKTPAHFEYVDGKNLTRFVTSWDTTSKDVEDFIQLLEEVI